MTIRIHELLHMAVKIGASDIHISAGEVPAMRVHGEVKRLELPRLSPDDAKRLAYSVMSEKQKTIFENEWELDFSIGLKGLARFRVNVFNQTRGIGMVLRQIPSKVLTLEELRAPKVFQRIANFKKGLVLVTGPTGSGKSTTLAAIIDYINKHRAEHILTVEDPVEFVHIPDQCIINQREVGAHTMSFANALKGALREDPDVILVGEMRDLETISLALTAASMGVLVFGTLHTNSAAKTMDRIINVFPSEEQDGVRIALASVIKGVLAQQLLRRKGGGRCAAVELLFYTPALASNIREGKTHQIGGLIQMGKKLGMVSMDDALKDLVERDLIEPMAALEKSLDKDLFREWLAERGVVVEADEPEPEAEKKEGS